MRDGHKYPDVIYDEIDDRVLKNTLMTIFNDDLARTHVVTEVVYLPNKNKWIVKIAKDYLKELTSEERE